MAPNGTQQIRTATISRKTGETEIECTLTLDHHPGTKQVIEVDTGVGFYNHVRSQ